VIDQVPRSIKGLLIPSSLEKLSLWESKAGFGSLCFWEVRVMGIKKGLWLPRMMKILR
jgi:hypothetical protein